MVKPNETVDLEPAPEDLLSVWGQEVTAQNLVKFFGSHAEAEPFSEGAWKPKRNPERAEVKAGADGSNSKGRKVTFSPFPPEKNPLQVSIGLQGSKIKPISIPARISGGLEDVINFPTKHGIWRSVGGGLKVGNVDSERGNRHTVKRSPTKLSQNPEGLSSEGYEHVRIEKLGKFPLIGRDSWKSGPGEAETVVPETENLGSQGVSLPQSPVVNRGTHPGFQEGANLKSQGEASDRGQDKPESSRRKEFSLKKKTFEGNLVLGMDVQVQDALTVAECTLVGRIRGRALSGKSLNQWAEAQWKNSLSNSFRVALLVKGWFMVSFAKREDADWVVERNWIIGNRPVLFQRWTPNFDANREKADEFPVWVRAPGLPPFLWVESVFKAIGDLLGTYLDADMSFHQTFERTMARILVRLNPKEGLAESIKLEYGEFVFEQPLDYEHLPFRCFRCHEYGHLAKDCPLGNRRRRPQKSEEQREKKVKKDLTYESLIGQKDGNRAEKNSNAEAPVKEVTSPMTEFQKTNESPAKSAKEMNAEDPVSAMEEPSGTPHDHCSDSIPSESNVNLKINDATPCRNVDCLSVEKLIDAIPSIDLNCEDVSHSLIKPAIPSLSCHYNLRSLGKKPEQLLESPDPIGGLGPASSHPSKNKGRGRKSNFSKAQVKAKFDVADGKQMSIPGALRAAIAPDQVVK